MNANTSIWAVAAAAVAAGIGLVASGGVAGASPDGHFHAHGHALFVETDASRGNQILSYRRAPDGTISLAGSYSTNEKGGTAAGAIADPLASQGGLALINDGAELVATNAGSDTITVFGVEGTRLTHLQQLPSGGQFPVSVAAHGRYLSILNSGGAGSVEQFRLFGATSTPTARRFAPSASATPRRRTTCMGPARSATRPTASTSSSRPRPRATPSRSSRSATTDGSERRRSSPRRTTRSPSRSPSTAPATSSRTEASNSSVSVYAVGANGMLSSLGTVPDGAKALCWIATSNGYFFGDNAGSGTVSSFDESVSGAPQLVAATVATAHSGTTDPAVSPDGRFLYVESGGAGTLDAYAIGAGGSLAQIETIFNLPVASEGIAAS